MAVFTRTPSATLSGTGPQPGGPSAFLSGSSGTPSSAAAAPSASASGCPSCGRCTGTGPSGPRPGPSPDSPAGPQPDERGQAGVVGPQLVAGRAPAVEVGRGAGDEVAAVERAGPAGHPA